MKNNEVAQNSSRESDFSSNTPEFVEKVIRINRVTKVCTGGKRLAFRALVIVGDLNGKVSIALGKSKEVPSAIKKAIERAKKRLSHIALVEGTIPHPIIGHFGASRVLLKPAPKGTGVIAGGSVRILLEAVGIKNVVAKSLGSNNPINTARAALEGLLNLKKLDVESAIRGKKLPVRFLEGEPVVVERRKAAKQSDDRSGNRRRGGQGQQRGGQRRGPSTSGGGAGSHFRSSTQAAEVVA